MREVEKLIERGAEKAGGQDKFAEKIGIAPNSLTEVKKGKRPLPAHAIEAAAEYLNEDKVTLAGKIFLEWKKIAACLILGFGLTSFPTNDLQAKMTAQEPDRLYIMRNIRNGWAMIKRKIKGLWNSLTSFVMPEYPSISFA
jgi:DNA-binding transcriptional regulator YdaS (Cro superfamily)